MPDNLDGMCRAAAINDDGARSWLMMDHYARGEMSRPMLSDEMVDELRGRLPGFMPEGEDVTLTQRIAACTLLGIPMPRRQQRVTLNCAWGGFIISRLQNQPNVDNAQP